MVNIELNVIYNEDCISENEHEGMNRIPDKSVDMILCDLPYGTTDKNKWDVVIPFEPLWKNYVRIIKDNGVILLTSQQPFTSELITSNKKMFRYEIIWEKTKPVGFFNAKKMPLRTHENILVFYKKLPKYNPELEDCTKKVKRPNNSTVYGTNRSKNNEYIMKKTGYPRSVIKFSNVMKKQLHPTQKPLDMWEWLIKLYTDEDDIVVDNCMGSGTTAVACINTNRRYVGFELDKEYYEKSLERIENCKLQTLHIVCS